MSTCKAFQLTSKDTKKYIPQVKMVLIKTFFMKDVRIINILLSYPRAIMQKYWEGIHQ